MTHMSTNGAHAAGSTPAASSSEPSAGALVSQMTEQMSRLIRDEMRLAQIETKSKAKDLGLGVGLFGGAGTMAFYGFGAFVAAAIAAFALVLPVWAAALIVGGILFLIAAVLAMTGKKEVKQATPPLPQEAISSVKTDVQTVKEHAKR